MKQYLRLAHRHAWALCLGMSLSGASAAADNCQVHAVPALVDYGPQHRQSILSQPTTFGGHALGKRLVSVNVVCSTPVRIALFLRGEPQNDRAFRFGEQGALSVVAEQATLDGKSLSLSNVEQTGQAPSEPSTRSGLQPGRGIVVMEQGLPAIGSRLSLMLELDPAVPGDVIAVVNSESTWSSSYQLELVAF
ncbi:hypothetical protein [Pseudomonas sp. SBT1-2]|uniref:hypothetical protein n=1 Tax=Pseudomonas sp. SBT1-2 TaxID=3027852 RepID=UPI00236054C4|nr:hypothetical protein [Pseudomonas sp. SBT1-2]